MNLKLCLKRKNERNHRRESGGFLFFYSKNTSRSFYRKFLWNAMLALTKDFTVYIM